MEIRDILAELKRTVRTGWAIEGIEHPESVADHTWGMTLLLLMAFDRLERHGEGSLDRERSLKMAIVHDLQEAITGGIILVIIGMDCALHRRRKMMEELA